MTRALAADTPSQPDGTEAATAADLPELHDAAHQADLLRDALQSDKARLGCFFGAGCPLGIYDEAGTRSAFHIPDVAGLTKRVRDVIEARDAKLQVEAKQLPLWDALVLECKGESAPNPNVEHVLGELRTLLARRGKSDVNGMSKSRLQMLDSTICDIIGAEVGKQLPKHRCSYHRFASWAGGIQRLVPLELFTPNYDLLIEEAFELMGIPLFDGFVGSRQPFLTSRRLSRMRFHLAGRESGSFMGR